MADYKTTAFKAARFLAALIGIGLLHKFESKNGSSKGLTALSGYVSAWGLGGLAGITSLLAMNIVSVAVGAALLCVICVGWLVVFAARRRFADGTTISITGVNENASDDHDLRDDAVDHGPADLDLDDSDEDDTVSVDVEEVTDDDPDATPA